jgi:hypothetical protein
MYPYFIHVPFFATFFGGVGLLRKGLGVLVYYQKENPCYEYY